MLWQEYNVCFIALSLHIKRKSSSRGKDICADCYAEMREYINRKNSKLYGKQAEQIIVDEAVSEVEE